MVREGVLALLCGQVGHFARDVAVGQRDGLVEVGVRLVRLHGALRRAFDV